MDREDSPAKKKRRPFTIKNGEQITHIYCIRHPTKVATFYCAVCGKPYDESCVGAEEEEKTICRRCAIGQGKSKNKCMPKWLPITMVAVAFAISVSNGIYYYINRPQLVGAITKPHLTEQVRNIVLCRQRLERIAREAYYYHKTSGAWPASLEMIKPLFEDKAMLNDPLTQLPFKVVVERAQFTVLAPSPEAYGLKALYAVPGKPAKMEYPDF